MVLRTPTLRTMAELHDLVAFYLQQDAFAFDVETVGARRGQPAVNQVTWLALATYGRTDVIAMGHPNGELIRPSTTFKEAYWDPKNVGKSGKVLKKWKQIRRPALFTRAPEQLTTTQVFAALEPLFFHPEITKVGHNLKFDLKSVAKYLDAGVPCQPYYDTMTAAALVFEENERKGLKDITKRFYETDYDQQGVGKQVEIWSYSIVAKYAHSDAYFTWKIFKDFLPVLPRMGLDKVFDVEMDILECLCHMELHGTRVDPEALRDLSDVLTGEVHEVTKRIYVAAGKKINLNATLDKRWLVYDHLGHRPWAFTPKTRNLPPDQQIPSTEKSVLESYVDKDPVVADLIEYNRLSKLISTYTGFEEDGVWQGGLNDHLIAGRVHTDFVATGAATGRFSSRTPNLQNIPARGDVGKAMRRIFLPDEGDVAVCADYSQIEYRILADFSGEPTLVDAFLNGYDPHAATAAILLDKAIEDVTPAERDMGKAFNFASVYGAGPDKLAQMAGISVAKAKAFMQDFDRRMKHITAWKLAQLKLARRQRPPQVETILARRRVLRPLHFTDWSPRFRAERQAINTIVQGSAAEIMKLAMVEVHQSKPEHWKMLITVHDELLLSVPEAEGEEAADCLEKWMMGVNPLKKIPLEVDAGVGTNWAEAK